MPGLPSLTLLDPNGKEYESDSLPRALITGTGLDPRPRLRVDVAQTSFLEGREFRIFKELSIANGSTWLARVVVTTDVVFHSAVLSIDNGACRLRSYAADATPTGTFSEVVQVFAKNAMSGTPTYSTGTTITAVPAGGTLAGGIIRDCIRAVTPTAQSATVVAVGDSGGSERGLPAGTYYFMFENIGSGTVTGTFHAHWEEKLPDSTVIN